jgi:hypothetical protein
MSNLLRSSKPWNVSKLTATPLMVRVALSQVTVNNENTLPQLLHFRWWWSPILEIEANSAETTDAVLTKPVLVGWLSTAAVSKMQQVLSQFKCSYMGDEGDVAVSEGSRDQRVSDRVSNTSKQPPLMEDNCSK